MVQPLTADQTRPLPPALDAMTLLVAAVIVHDHDAHRVLLLQRGPHAKFAQGKWDLPVGKNHPGESVTATAVRELHEETGLTVAASDLELAHVIHGARGIEAPHGFLTVVFATRRWTGSATNAEPEKHSQVCWVDTAAVPEDFVPTTYMALTRYLSGGPSVSLEGWPPHPAGPSTERH